MKHTVTNIYSIYLCIYFFLNTQYDTYTILNTKLYISLFCLVTPDPAFPVNKSETVGKLGEFIKKEHEHTFTNVDFKDLKL